MEFGHDNKSIAWIINKSHKFIQNAPGEGYGPAGTDKSFSGHGAGPAGAAFGDHLYSGQYDPTKKAITCVISYSYAQSNKGILFRPFPERIIQILRRAFPSAQNLYAFDWKYNDWE